MSPHVGNFVQDLVEMAKATERLPGLEAELAKAHDDIESYAKSLQAREIAILEYKAEIERLQDQVRNAEVSRDDAELRFLSLEETSHMVRRVLNDIASSAQNQAQQITAAIEPEPKPQPEPVKAEVVDHAAEDLAKSYDFPQGNVDQGQSEPDPTATQAMDTQPANASSGTVDTIASASTGVEPSPGPYSGIRYYDHPSYVGYDRWIEGGGTDANYHWRPGARPTVW